MALIDFPAKDILSYWVDLIKQSDEPLKEISDYLPAVDVKWVSKMEDVFERVELKYHHAGQQAELSDVVAETFYNIIKLHAEIDGNKRSALICVYLLFVLNVEKSLKGSFLLSKKGLFKVYKMSKRIAKSKGNRFAEAHKKRLSKEFSELLRNVH